MFVTIMALSIDSCFSSSQEAVDGVAFAAFVASGQTCVSGKRILVQAPIFEDFRVPGPERSLPISMVSTAWSV